MYNEYIHFTFVCVSDVKVGLSSLYLSLWFLSDLAENYPLVIWGIFTRVVVVAVHRRNMLGCGVVFIP